MLNQVSILGKLHKSRKLEIIKILVRNQFPTKFNTLQKMELN